MLKSIDHVTIEPQLRSGKNSQAGIGPKSPSSTEFKAHM